MLTELLFAINPLNWDASAIGAGLQPMLLLMFFLVFAVLLIDIANFNKNIITPNHGAAVIIALFLAIRYIGVGIMALVIPLIYLIFIAVRERAHFAEKQMYTLSEKPSRRPRNASKSDGTPVVVTVVKIFFKACWFILSILPFYYMLQALEQFETPPNMIISYIGIAIMLFAVVSLARCISDYSMQNKNDEEEKKKKGYITTGKFKATQSPVQFYEMLFFFGALITGAMFYFGVVQWFMVLLSYLVTRKIMLIKAAQLEQFRKTMLDNDTDYKKYAIRTSIFNPIFPKFTLLKPQKEIKANKAASEQSSTPTQTEENPDGKKKRPKKERPKKERPKKEKKDKADKE